MGNLKITTLIENNQDNSKKLNFEHGLSLYIELEELKRVYKDRFIKNNTGNIININLNG